MEIIHLGHSCFRVKGKYATVICDPFDPQILGPKLPKIPADILTISHQHFDHNYFQGITENPVIIAGAGEYEIKGVRIIGINTFHDQFQGKERGTNTVYRIEIEGVSLVHLGDLGHTLDDNHQELLGEVNILLIPVGEVSTLSVKEGIEVISKLEPNIIIPMHYSTSSLKKEYQEKFSKLSIFLKQIEKENIEPQSKLVITKDKLPEETTVVVLES